MAAFTASAADGVSAAAAMQRGVARRNERDPLLGLAIRVGLALPRAGI